MASRPWLEQSYLEAQNKLKNPSSTSSSNGSSGGSSAPVSLNKTYQTKDIGETGYTPQDTTLTRKSDGTYAYVANSLLNGNNSYSNPLENGTTYTVVNDASNIDPSQILKSALYDWTGRGGAAPGQIKTQYGNYAGGSSSYGGGSDYISDEYDNLISALKAQIQQSINNKQQQINGLPQKYQPQRNQSEVQKASDLRMMLEQSANTGDRGGVGRQNALETQTAGANRLNTIDLQQQNEVAQLQNDIANLTLEGDIQSAQLAAQKLRDLLAQSNADRDYDLNVANLTGNLNGQRTLAGQQLDSQKDDTAYNRSQDALNRTDRLNEAMGYVNPTANVTVPSNIRQQLAQYSNDYTAYANANPNTELGYYARVLANEKVFSDPALLQKYGGQFKTAAQRQQDIENLYRQKTFDYQVSRDTVADTQWQKAFNLDMRKQTFSEAQAKIENGLAQQRINQEGASQALQWAKFNADQDPNSLDNQLKRIQIDNAKNNSNSAFTIDDWAKTLDNEFLSKRDSSGAVVTPGITSNVEREKRILGLGLSADMTRALYQRYNIPLP